MPTTDSSQRIHNEQDGEITLKDVALKLQEWYCYLITKWLVILIAGVLGGSVGFLYAISKKPEFIAKLTFALEDKEGAGGLGAYSGLASMVGLDLGGSNGGAFTGENLIEFMKSRSMIEKALLNKINIQGKEQTLTEYYININGLRNVWKDNERLRNVSFPINSERSKFTRDQDSLLGVFYKNIVTNSLFIEKIDRKLSIVNITVSTRDEIFSKLFTETLVKEVSDFYVETRTKKSVVNLAILQHQTDSVRNALNSAITGVATSVDLNPNPNLARVILRVPQQRRQVDVQANQAILTELVKNLELAKISLRKETPLIQIIDRPILPLTKKATSKTQSTLIGGFITGVLAIIGLILRKQLNSN